MFKRKTIKDLRKAITMRLAGTLVDVELEKDELDYAIGFALDVYRQRAENATKEQGIIDKSIRTPFNIFITRVTSSCK